jgi:hypothetical protein
MRKYCTRFVKLSLLALATLAVAACAGGSGKDSGGVSIPGITTASITGTLASGSVAVVDADSNTEVRRVVSAGYGAGWKSFDTPVSAGKRYKFYLIENEGSAEQRVYALYQGAANKFSIATVTSIDFGFISTVSGVAVPANDITKIKGVTSSGEDRSFPASLASSALASGDLQGNWQVLQLVCGSNSRWVRSVVAIDATGASQASGYVSSLDSGTLPAASYAITPGGVVTSKDGFTNGFSGVMTPDKSMIVGTATLEAGNYALVVMLKPGAAYSATDLKGSWKYHQLAAGAHPAWARGDASIDPSGILTSSNPAGSASDGGPSPASALSIDPSGVVSSPVSPSFYGVMSGDKNLMFGVDGDQSSPTLTIFTRVSGAAFSVADLSSFGELWRANWLSATGSSSSSSYWGRGYFNANSGYTASYLQSILQSFGASTDATLATSVDPTGVVGFDNTNFSGFIAPGKNFMVGVMTEGNGNFALYTFVK